MEGQSAKFNEDIIELLDRGTVDVIDRNHIVERLSRGEKLRVKLGIDPSGTDLHLGHAVVVRKLRQFQLRGHTVVLIIGDWTARIGDPSGRKETRPQLTPQEVKANAEKYLSQLSLILDLHKIEVRWQSEWYDTFTLQTIIELAAKFTVQQLLQRDDFKERMKAGVDVRYHEPLYCLLQGYDSVAVKADLELGGNDQLFNLLKGREVQAWYQQPMQDVLTMPLLIGLDGVQKMGKSLNNYIALADAPRDMYGKIMSLPDELIIHYFTLTTDLPLFEIHAIEEQLKKGKANPRDLKSRLAREVIALYHGLARAQEAEAEFVRVFRDHELPEDMAEVALTMATWRPDELLVALYLVSSKAEAQRVIGQKGMRCAGVIIKDWKQAVTVKDGDVVQVGKRRYAKVMISQGRNSF
ncbi:tyrosine--tRNA ligase [Candidatus Uhrbacteria bacterium RIFCSPLOWO2_02_FULL_49_11]|uniref:Tyrosine--tRNA ligase n=1 Tax=Candidatus Uhrbacteria bacterium RIFCSPLOWO2_02_FULL_49_11 TaxID=1802409 RepID=A0A1F7VEP5_9BACT|nr:MAG: tyrosine--tRNA ligase [Candidatus Uhrbacteria bacterium RIFCSPLOWO2_02_FULL_49_11]